MVTNSKLVTIFDFVQGKVTLSNQINKHLAKIDSLKYLEMNL